MATSLFCCLLIKPAGLFFNEDLAKETMEKREDQRPKMEEAKRNGKMVYFMLDRLIVKDRPARSR